MCVRNGGMGACVFIAVLWACARVRSGGISMRVCARVFIAELCVCMRVRSGVMCLRVCARVGVVV